MKYRIELQYYCEYGLELKIGNLNKIKQEKANTNSDVQLQLHSGLF